MNIALILAGGQGARMGSKLPKQFLLLEGKPVIIRSIEAFERHPDIGAICVVCGEPWSGRLKYQIEQAGFRKVCAVIPGGATRRESSFLGLEYLTRHYAGTDIVLIHDAARPLVTQRIISDNIACAARHQACTTVIPAQDTLLESLNQKNGPFRPGPEPFFCRTNPPDLPSRPDLSGPSAASRQSGGHGRRRDSHGAALSGLSGAGGKDQSENHIAGGFIPGRFVFTSAGDKTGGSGAH